MAFISLFKFKSSSELWPHSALRTEYSLLSSAQQQHSAVRLPEQSGLSLRSSNKSQPAMERVYGPNCTERRSLLLLSYIAGWLQQQAFSLLDARGYTVHAARIKRITSLLCTRNTSVTSIEFQLDFKGTTVSAVSETERASQASRPFHCGTASRRTAADTSNRYSKKYRPYGIYCLQENYFSALYFLVV